MQPSFSHWHHAWSRLRFRVQVTATAVALPVALIAFSRFLLWVEERPGAVLDDPLLAVLPPADGSTLTFTLIYGGLVLGLTALGDVRLVWSKSSSLGRRQRRPT